MRRFQQVNPHSGRPARLTQHALHGAVHGHRPQPVHHLGAQPEQRQPCSATGLRKRIFGRQRLDKLEYSGPGERRIDGHRRCRQCFSMDQGGRRWPRRSCVVWLRQERGPQQPVRASLERLHVPSCICDRFHGGGQRCGSKRYVGESQPAPDALQRRMSCRDRLHRAARQPQPRRLFRRHD